MTRATLAKPNPTVAAHNILALCDERGHPVEGSIHFRLSAPIVAKAYLELQRNVDSLYAVLKHGDEAHQQWLTQTIAKHFGKNLGETNGEETAKAESGSGSEAAAQGSEEDRSA